MKSLFQGLLTASRWQVRRLHLNQPIALHSLRAAPDSNIPACLVLALLVAAALMMLNRHKQ